MNIIFSEISEISPLSVYFWEKIIFAFFGRRIISYIWYLYIYTKLIMFPCIFWERSSFIFRLKKNIMFSLKKNYHLSRYYEKDHISSEIILEKPSFQNIWRKHILMYFFFFGERSSFLFRLTNNIIFLGKRNIIFPEKTRNIPFQCHFFGKIIFSEHLEKEIMFFRAVYIFSF